MGTISMQNLQVNVLPIKMICLWIMVFVALMKFRSGTVTSASVQVTECSLDRWLA